MSFALLRVEMISSRPRPPVLRVGTEKTNLRGCYRLPHSVVDHRSQDYEHFVVMEQANDYGVITHVLRNCT